MNKSYPNSFLPLIKTASILGLAIALTACGGSSGKSKSKDAAFIVKSVTTDSVDVAADPANPEGLATPNPSFIVGEEGDLQISIPGIDHEGTIYKTLVENLNTDFLTEIPVGAEADGDFCKPIKTSDSKTKYDISVVLDTTGSMGAHARNFANKAADFAEALETEANLDVRFAGITYGDAYATLNSESSTYSSAKAKGTLNTPPLFDSTERPDTGLNLLSSASIQEFFTEVADVVGTGLGGGDNPENSLGPIYFQNTNVNFRSGAARMYIVIGDNCAHTETTIKGISYFDSTNPDHATWVPPAVEEIEENLRLSGAAVHLIWRESKAKNCGSYYGMDDIRSSTGGVYAELDSNLDLASLPLIEALGDKRERLSCDLPKPETKGVKAYKLTFDLVIAEIGAKWTVTAILIIN